MFAVARECIRHPAVLVWRAASGLRRWAVAVLHRLPHWKAAAAQGWQAAPRQIATPAHWLCVL